MEQGPSTSSTSESRVRLTIVVDAKYEYPMGYGHVWNAKVRKVVDGTLTDRTVEVSLYPNADGRKYAGRFRSVRGDEKSVRLRLRRGAEMPAALEGFRTSDGTVWELIDVDGR